MGIAAVFTEVIPRIPDFMDACHDQRVLRSNTSHEIGLDCSYNVINNLDLEPKCNNQSLELNDSVSDYDESPIDSESESPYLRGVQGIGRQPNNLQCLRAQDAIPRGKRRKPLPVPPRWYAEYIQHFQFDPIEWKSPKYKQYREKQATPKEREKGKKGPWNDEIEYAFQKALRLHGGRGRAKDDLGGKLCGGNEWIAWCIWVQTRVALDRKQVSSHLQVLKGKMKDNIPWVELATEVQRQDDRERRSRQKHLGQSRTQQPGKALQGVFLGGTLPSNEPQRPVIHSVDFGMYVRSKVEHEKDHMDQPLTHHTYTQMEYERASAPRDFTDASSWQQAFRRMSLQDEFEANIPTYLFDVGIRLKDEIIAHTRLELALDLIISNGTGHADWFTRTQIRDEMGLYDVGCEKVQIKTREDSLLELRPVNMGASFWLKLFVNFSQQKSIAKSSGDAMRSHQEDCIAQRFLSDVRMFQQLCATPVNGGSRPIFVANLLWQYHLVAADRVPTTSYRPLSSPVTRNHLSAESAELAEWMASELGSSDQALLQSHYPYQESTQSRILNASDHGNSALHILPPPLVQPLASTESSPVTELTNDAGSSLSSASIQLLPSMNESVSLSNTMPYDFTDSYTFDEAYSSFDSASNHVLPSKVPNLYSGPTPHIESDYRIDDTLLSQDHYNDISAHFPDFIHCLPQDSAALADEDLTAESGQLLCNSTSNFETSAGNTQDQNSQRWQMQNLPLESGSPLVAPRAQSVQHCNHILQLQHLDFLAQDTEQAEHGAVVEDPQTSENHSSPNDVNDSQRSSEVLVEHQDVLNEDSPQEAGVEEFRSLEAAEAAASDHVPICEPPFLQGSPAGNVFDVDWHLIDPEKHLEGMNGTDFAPNRL